MGVAADAWRVLPTAAVGVATGVLSGMFGVGGAILSTPAIRALGGTTFEAVGSTLPSIVPSAISGTLRYRREGLVRWRIAAVTASVGAAVAAGASFLSHAVPGRGHLLMIATAALMGGTAVQVGRSHVEALPERAPPGPRDGAIWRPVVIGVAAGGLSGLLGVGGGVVMLPGFAWWLGLPIKEAVATSLACVGVLALPATVVHAFLGDIDWWFALPLAVAVVPGARLGAHLAIRTSERGLRMAIAVVLGSIAVAYGAIEVAVLL